MRIRRKLSTLASLLLLTTSLNAFEIDATAGVHDFIVADIKDDTPADNISGGTSHTLGFNVGLSAMHTTPSGIHLLAKAEAFLDHDKDKLDADHIPVWFKFLIDIDGDITKFNENSVLKWYILMDNKQNTVSCIERQVRQHVGIGYEYKTSSFSLAANAYAGFYYLEIDDDTPSLRGYPRSNNLDNGEASNVFELEGSYRFNQNFYFHAAIKRYSANTGFEKLEDDVNFLLSYKDAEFLGDGVSLNCKVEYSKYNFDSYNTGVLPILPWDNDTLVQVYASIPLKL